MDKFDPISELIKIPLSYNGINGAIFSRPTSKVRSAQIYNLYCKQDVLDNQCSAVSGVDNHGLHYSDVLIASKSGHSLV